LIYEVTLNQTYYGQSIVNRWNYLSTGTPVGVTGAYALLFAMGFIDTSGVLPADTLGGDLQTLQPNAVKFNNVLSKAIREAPTDFIDRAYPVGMQGAGGAGKPQSPIDSYGFFTNRVRTDIARGTKRFVGVDEDAVAPGGEIESAQFAVLNELADDMTEVLSYTEDGNSLTFAPIVVSKLEYTTPSGKRAYKYYPTIATQLEHIAQGITWQPYTQIRSQVSRQYKRGA